MIMKTFSYTVKDEDAACEAMKEFFEKNLQNLKFRILLLQTTRKKINSFHTETRFRLEKIDFLPGCSDGMQNTEA